MAILTDFFAANTEGLRDAFPGWMEVGAKDRPVKNPRTGVVRLTWAPLPASASLTARPTSKGFLSRLFTRTRAAGPSRAQTPQYASLFPTVQFKGVDIVKLCTLEAILVGTGFDEALAAYDKPALLSPNEEEQLYELPSALVIGLSRLADDRLPDVAQKWAETDELRIDQWSDNDAREVVDSLRSLARQADKSSVSLYHYWSL